MREGALVVIACRNHNSAMTTKRLSPTVLALLFIAAAATGGVLFVLRSVPFPQWDKVARYDVEESWQAIYIGDNRVGWGRTLIDSQSEPGIVLAEIETSMVI